MYIHAYFIYMINNLDEIQSAFKSDQKAYCESLSAIKQEKQ